MKQVGKSWKTAEGEETLAKYLPAHVKLFEKLGQRIAADAIGTEQHLRLIKAMFIDLCREALRNSPDTVRRRLTFHTFDREFKIEFDIKEEYVRVYRATKSNPSSKDYELINMDFNKSAVEVADNAPSSPLEDFEAEKPNALEDFESVEEEKNAMAVGVDIERGAGDDYPVVETPNAADDVYAANMQGIDQERGQAYNDTPRPAPENQPLALDVFGDLPEKP